MAPQCGLDDVLKQPRERDADGASGLREKLVSTATRSFFIAHTPMVH